MSILTEKEYFYAIASHVRTNYSPVPFYLPEHMLIVVKNFLYMHKVEQQGYKPCASLMKLGDKYSLNRLEKACEKAFGYTPSPSLKNRTTILKNGQDKVATIQVKSSNKSSSYGITRGASYPGGDR